MEDFTIYICELSEGRFFWVAATYDEVYNLTGTHGYAASREQAERDAKTARPAADVRFLSHNQRFNRGDEIASDYRRRLNARSK